MFNYFNMWQLLMQGLFILIYAAVGIWQYNLIKSLKEKLKVLESFQSIFDVDKLTKYIELIKSKHSLEIDNIKTERTDDSVKAAITQAMEKIPERTLKQYEELGFFTISILKQLPKETREWFIMMLPENEQILRATLIDLDKQGVL